MLTYRVGSGGASSGALLANYYATSDSLPVTASTFGAYYTAPSQGAAAQVVPNAGMHPVIANRLGVDPTRPIAKEELANILAGKRADGQPIVGKRKTKNTFIDFTFSAPKSLSIAIVFAPTQAEREKLEKCHRDAAASVMALIAQEIGTASIGNTAGNRARNREPAHIAMFSVEHYAARPPIPLPNGDDTILADLGKADMHRHTHVLVPNVAVTDEGRATVIYQEGLDQRVHEYGALYSAFLATNLRKHGVNVELDRTPGLSFHERMARLTDVPREVCDFFSKRHNSGRQEVERLAAAMGVDLKTLSPTERIEWLGRAINQQRRAKEKEGGEYASWVRQAESINYRHRSVLRPGQEQWLRSRKDRIKDAYDLTLPMLAEQFARRAVIEGSVPRVAAAKALIETGVSSADEVSMITNAMRTEGVIQDGVTTSVHWAFDTEKRYARVTTQLSVEMEQEAVDLLRAAAADTSVALSPQAVDRAIKKVVAEAAASGEKLDFTTGHGAKQRDLIDKVAAAGRAMVWVGVAGSGKSTALRVPIAAWHEAGRDTYGITLAWRQTQGLQDAGVGRGKRKWEPDKGNLVNAGVAADRTFAMDPFLKGVEAGTITPTRNSTVIIDELGLVGTHQILRLARLQAKHGFQLIGLGDDLQCQSVEAGATIDLARRAFGAENVPELLSTVRQKTVRDRETAMLFRAGNATEALQRKDEDGTLRIVPGGYEDAVQAVVDLWWERTRANAGRDRYTLGISVPTNADGRAIGEAIRARRKEAGEVGPDRCEVDATDQNGASYKMRLAVGDRIRLFHRIKVKGTFVGNNGSVVTVLDVTNDGLKVRTARDKEAFVGWESFRKKDNPLLRMSYGDAVTIDARQSDTVTEHITAMPAGSAAVNGFGIYTADSRHKARSWIVTSQGAEKIELQNRRSMGDPANDETDPVKVKAAVMKNMARNLSRQPKKTLALDFLDHARNLRSGTVDAKLAAWFHQEPLKAAKAKPAEPATPPAQRPQEAATAGPAPQPVNPTPKPQASAPKAPPRQEPPKMSAAEVQAAFAAELQRQGFRLKGAPVMDGRWHRASVDGDRGNKKSGGYRWIEESSVGLMTNFKGPPIPAWHPERPSQEVSPEDRARRQAELEEARKRDEAKRLAREEETAKQAEQIWKATVPADPNHRYLQKKGIGPSVYRQAPEGTVAIMSEGKPKKIGGWLISPLRDVDGKLWNVQMTSPAGDKFFLPGRKKALFTVIGKDDDPSLPLMFAEGMATGETLHNTTSLRTVVTYDSGNLLPVAMEIRAKLPNRDFIFGADNDHHLPGLSFNREAGADGKMTISWPKGATGKAKGGNTVEYRVAGDYHWTPARFGMRETEITIPHLLPGARYEARVYSTDHKQPLPNVGVEKAREAAKAVGGKVAIPSFEPGDPGTDYNDYVQKHGAGLTALELAKHGVPIVVAPTPSKPQEMTPAQRQAHAPAPKQHRPELRT